MMFFLVCSFFLIFSSFFSFFRAFDLSEPPQFIKEPEKHITAEMEKVVDIPCQARGEYGFILSDKSFQSGPV